MSDRAPDSTGEELDQTFGKLGVEVSRLAKQSSRNQTILLLTVLSVVLDIVLSIVVWQYAVTADRAAHEAQSAKAQASANCRTNNDQGQKQIQLWSTVVAQLPKPATETPDQAQQRETSTALFFGIVNQVFAPADCTKVQTAAAVPAKLPPAATTLVLPTTTTTRAS